MRKLVGALSQLCLTAAVCVGVLFLLFSLQYGEFSVTSWQAFTEQVEEVYADSREFALRLRGSDYLEPIRELGNEIRVTGEKPVDGSIAKDGISIAGPYPTNVVDVFRLEGSSTHGQLMVITEKESRVWHDLPLHNGNFAQDIYLVEGSGAYKVHVAYHVEGNTYRFAHTFTVTNEQSPAFSRFLIPVREIESDHPDIINAAKQITQQYSGDQGKIKAVYNWVQRNIRYDDAKAERIENNLAQHDVFGALHVLRTRSGVCQDYASLAAALLRAVGIEAKLVVGTATNYSGWTGGHAWNEAYDRESGRWIHFDATWASTSGQNWFDKDLSATHVKEDES